jgi:beta-galactosidase
LLPLKVTEVASLRPTLAERVAGPHVAGTVARWREWLQTDLPVLASFADGWPAIVGDDRRLYIAGWPETDLLTALMAELLGRRAGLRISELPDSVRLRRCGDLTFAFNYGNVAWTAAPVDAEYLLGEAEVGPQQVACWRKN